MIFGNQWSLVRKVLTADIEMALDNYWDRVRQEEKEEGVVITPAAEVSLKHIHNAVCMDLLQLCCY